jgi:8-oxo-dGTP pyrophosphatase MutT (NUDIX family)
LRNRSPVLLNQPSWHEPTFLEAADETAAVGGDPCSAQEAVGADLPDPQERLAGVGHSQGVHRSGETRRQAALKEAREEAGLVGRVIGGAIGMYDYDKRGATYTVAVYMMEVLEVRSTWLEKSWRERRWHSLERAALLLKGHPVRSILKRVNRLL